MSLKLRFMTDSNPTLSATLFIQLGALLKSIYSSIHRSGALRVFPGFWAAQAVVQAVGGIE